ncbi:MAG: hypothetical protein WCC17_08965 [Candidatus Nitrosopolaris sp.]
MRGSNHHEYKATLGIVDNIISLHRDEFAGKETFLADWQQRLNIMLHKLY